MNEFTPAPNVPEVPLCETLQSFAQDFLGPVSQELGKSHRPSIGGSKPFNTQNAFLGSPMRLR
jgi:hypothetical protein